VASTQTIASIPDNLGVMVFNANFQQYFSYILEVSFIDGENWRKQLTCCKP
jgi:hypothetical protein